MAMEDLVIGKDVLLQECETLHDLLQVLPHRAQVGPKTIVGQVRGIKEHGMKHLFSSLKENLAHESIDIEYSCFDISHQVVALGSNLGMIFFYDRENKQLTRFSSHTCHEPVTCVKLLSLQSLLASGHHNGSVLIFSYSLSPRSLPKSEYFSVSGVHTSTVLCLEWSPDGSLLYCGDEEGNISVTVVKVPGATQSVLLFTENSSVVQLSYSQSALLVSTRKRTVLWSFATEQPVQVGQKERKSPGKFGACFYPPARVLMDDEKEPSLTIYTARPGLRLWTADMNGKVQATLMYKGLMNENPPGVNTLTPLPSPSLAAATKIDQSALATPQFGQLQNYHGQFVVTWDMHQLWVLDTSPCALVCYYYGSHGDIADVCTVGHEIYILQQKSERLIRKFSLIPKLPNPLLEFRKLVLHTRKLEPVADCTDVEKKATPKRDEVVSSVRDVEKKATPKRDEVFSSVVEDNQPVEDGIQEDDDDKTQDLAALAAKLQGVYDEDYGDIVFKPKKSKRKQKIPDNQDSSRDSESAIEETSDISSELDYLDRSVSNTTSTDDDSPSVPRLTLVNVQTNDQVLLQENASLDTSFKKMENESNSKVITPTDEPGQTMANLLSRDQNLSQSNDSVLTLDQVISQSDDSTLPSDRSFIQSDESVLARMRKVSQSDDSTLASDRSSIQSDESTLTRLHKVSQSDDSTLDDHEYSAENPESNRLDLYSLPPIYSSTSLNISDISFSDASCDRSLVRQDRIRYSPEESSQRGIDVIKDSPISEEGYRTDSSYETPPVCLDNDGAEELGETSSWASSSRTLSELGYASLEFFRSIERTYTSQMSQNSKTSQSSADQVHLLVDSWSDVRLPLPGYVTFLDVSDLHIWVVTNYESIFYCPTHYEAVTWTQLEGQARMISVNNSGDVIWCVDGKNNAFARQGIRDGNLIGNQWLIVDKNIKYVAVDDTAVWGIMQNGDVFMRIDVSKEKPEGKTGKTIATNTSFVQASCLDGLVWFVDKKNIIHVYKEIFRENPTRKENWHTLTAFSTRWACLKIYGWSWIVDNKGSLWFTDKVTHESPCGSEWYQVSLGQYLMQDKTLLDTLWSWVRRGDETKLLTASPKAGLWILGKNGSLNSSRGHLLGTHWQTITPAGVAKSVFWSYISARGYNATESQGNLWALQPSGELICFHPGSRTIAVESPRTVIKLVAASSQTVWGITHNFRVVQRLGVMEDLCPQGVNWKSVELSSFSVGRVCHISSGTLCTWAVDESGGIWLRIGEVENTDKLISQVWIEVSGEPIPGNRFVKVAVSPDDAIVWALDDRFNVYARRDVTPNYQVGTSWEVVPGTIVKDLCISNGYMVWAVCANGDIACRYGVKESYPLGDYWKKVPGNFEHISVTPDGELWAINLNGQLFRRKTKHFYGTQSPFKERKYSCLFGSEEEWEII